MKPVRKNKEIPTAQAFEEAGSESGNNLAHDDVRYRDRVDPVFFDGLLNDPVEPHSPGAVVESAQDRGHGDQSGDDEDGIRHSLDILNVTLEAPVQR